MTEITAGAVLSAVLAASPHRSTIMISIHRTIDFQDAGQALSAHRNIQYDMDKEIFYILDNLHTKNVDDILLSPFVITFDEMYRMASSFNSFFLNSNMSSYYEFSMESNEVCSLKDVVVVLEKLLSYGEKNYVYPEEYTLHKIKKLQKNELRIAIEQMYIKGNSRNVFYTLFNHMLTNNGVECNRIIEKEGELREKWDNIRDMILRYSYNSVQSEEQLILDEIRNAKKLEMKFRKIAREILSINNWKDNRRVKEYCIINNNNCTIIEKKNAFRVNLTSDYIYDLWNISNDGIQIYPCEKISGLSVFVKTRFDRNEQFHAGVIVNDKEGNRFLFGVFEYTKIILCCPSLADNYEIKSYDIANDDAVGLEVNVLKNDMVSFKVANKAQLFSHEIRIDSGVESIGLFARTWGRVDGVVYFTDIKKIDSL